MSHYKNTGQRARIIKIKFEFCQLHHRLSGRAPERPAITTFFYSVSSAKTGKRSRMCRIFPGQIFILDHSRIFSRTKQNSRIFPGLPGHVFMNPDGEETQNDPWPEVTRDALYWISLSIIQRLNYLKNPCIYAFSQFP